MPFDLIPDDPMKWVCWCWVLPSCELSGRMDRWKICHSPHPAHRKINMSHIYFQKLPQTPLKGNTRRWFFSLWKETSWQFCPAYAYMSSSLLLSSWLSSSMAWNTFGSHTVTKCMKSPNLPSACYLKSDVKVQEILKEKCKAWKDVVEGVLVQQNDWFTTGKFLCS